MAVNSRYHSIGGIEVEDTGPAVRASNDEATLVDDEDLPTDALWRCVTVCVDMVDRLQIRRTASQY